MDKRSSADLKDNPSSFDPSVGTVAYYAPWGNLALFYLCPGWTRSPRRRRSRPPSYA
ncbi:cyclophilin-like fold protein [Caballeronia choica]|uniref:cyclophilin-like fold protein n=1 Tax=Caballeronia choica TaxID=326476 RepID=UPI0013592778